VSIRLRLALTYAAGLAVTMAVAGFVVWWQVGDALQASLRATLETRAVGVLTSLENNGQAGLQEGDAASTGTFIAVFRSNGTLLDASANAPLPLKPASGFVTLNGTAYLLRQDVAPNGQIVVTGADTAPLTAARDELARSMLLAAAAAGVVSLAFGSWLAGRALRPVDAMTHQAAALGTHDLEWRLPEPRRNDELGRLARTLNAMLERVAHAAGEQRDFLAAASHDLRTPISALRAELELADRPDCTEADLRAAVRAAHSDADRLTKLATELLTQAMAPADHAAVVRRPVRVDEVLRSSVHHVESVARLRGVRIDVRSTLEQVRLDPLRMEHALVNLLDNAVRHSPPGSVVDASAQVLDRAGRSRLVIRVLDRGPGLPPGPSEVLFQRGYRGLDPRGDGVGLGLANARESVRAHGGAIGARDRPGGGAEFWITLPLSGERAVA
jgi:signal transduction histidine kinase